MRSKVESDKKIQANSGNEICMPTKCGWCGPFCCKTLFLFVFIHISLWN